MSKKKKALKLIKNIDWSELRNQKTILLQTINAEQGGNAEMLKELDGIVHLIDAIQDFAVDVLKIPEMEVFNFEDEENREHETPEEFFAREMAETLYELSVESDGVYFDIPEGMTNEDVDAITNDVYHAGIMKSLLKVKILEDVLNAPNDFSRDEDGKLCYDYHLITDYGGIVDNYIRHQFYKDKVKTVYRCQHCKSDNVETKAWVNANTNQLSSDPIVGEGNEAYCLDCQQHGELVLDTIPYLENFIGFQVINDKGELHPKLKGDTVCKAYVCNLSQAHEMIDGALDKDGNSKWALSAVWSDNSDEENESILMFGTDPRE
jgi:hypothetical protein